MAKKITINGRPVTDDEYMRKLGEVVSSDIGRAGYELGIKAAASFAGSWDAQITGTPFTFEDIILGKFNLVKKNKMRRKAKGKGKKFFLCPQCRGVTLTSKFPRCFMSEAEVKKLLERHQK